MSLSQRLLTKETQARPPSNFQKWKSTVTSLAVLTLINALPAHAGFLFKDYVAERNLATTGLSNESFPNSSDSVNRFNGALRYTLPIGQVFQLAEGFSYQLNLDYSSSVWQFNPVHSVTSANPHPRFNAGLGWNLAFGRLLPPASNSNSSNFWVYESTDGSRARFHNEFAEGSGSTAGVYYSRNSTYLRLQIINDTAKVEFPNGMAKTFLYSNSDQQWRFISESDSFGNSYSVDYSTANQWVITDSHGRTHRVHLTSDPSGYYGSVVDRVELAAFAGSSATWDFTYSTLQVPRPSQDNSLNTPSVVSIPILDSVIRPDSASWAFEYAASPPLGIESGGRLSAVVLPGNGRIEYEYQNVAFPFFSGAEYAADVVGIATRSLVGPLATLGTWNFSFELDKARDQGIDQPRERTTTVLFPDSHRRRHYFSVYVSGASANDQIPSSPFVKREYAFPTTKNGRVAGSAFHRSMETFSADNSLLRSAYTHYSRSQCTGCFDMNIRRDHHRTVYHDDDDRFMTSVLSNFDGLGHFGKATKSASEQNSADHVTEYDYVGQVPLTNQPWFLGSYTAHRISQNGEVRQRQVCQDPQSGKVLRERIQATANPSPEDFIHAYGYDAQGNLNLTRYYGGDVQPLPTGDLCSLTLPATEQYAKYREHSWGQLAEAGWLAADGSVFLQGYVATIDRNTGRPLTVDHGDGLTWAYSYDSLGRRTQATPPTGQGGAETIAYSVAETHSTVTDVNGVVIQESKNLFDPFERLTAKSSRTINGWENISYSRNAMGQLTSTVYPDGSTTSTLGFDPFGRPLRIRPPEGAQHDRVLTYTGNRLVQTVVQIGKEWNEITQSVDEVARTTISEHDLLGRVTSKQTIDADGESRTETFSYSLDGEVLSTVTTDGVRTNTRTSPDRTDHRGLRVLDGAGNAITGYDALGNLTVRDFGSGELNQIFDRAGRLFEQREASNNRLWERYVYGTSNAGDNVTKGKLVRRLRVNRDVPHALNGYVLVTEDLEYRGVGGSLSGLSTRVTSGFGEAMPLFTFHTEQSQDALGNLEELVYPDCEVDVLNTNVQCTRLPTRTLTLGQEFGALTEVTTTVGGANEPWITQTTFASGGFVTGRTFGNGLTESATAHASGGGRVEQLTLSSSGGALLYDSGVAEYDGLGRMVKLGNQRRISDQAYSLRVRELPADMGAPTSPPAGATRDIFGMPRWRFYSVPARDGVQSGDGKEDVWEIYVYAPGNRRLWTRTFNDYDAWNYHRSEDDWNLVDPSGRSVRTRHGFTHYQGQTTYANAEIDHLALDIGGEPEVDKIYLGHRLLGTSDNRGPLTAREFFHYDIHGNLFAISDQDGEIRQNLMMLY